MVKQSGSCRGAGLGWLTDCVFLRVSFFFFLGGGMEGGCHVEGYCFSVCLFDCRLVDLCLGQGLCCCVAVLLTRQTSMVMSGR